MPYGDVLIHAGDFTELGLPSEVKKFNEWLGSLPYEYKIVIAGNHELTFDQEFMADLIKQDFYYFPSVSKLKPENYENVQSLLTNCIYLQDSEVSVRGFRVYGSPWLSRLGPQEDAESGVRGTAEHSPEADTPKAPCLWPHPRRLRRHGRRDHHLRECVRLHCQLPARQPPHRHRPAHSPQLLIPEGFAPLPPLPSPSLPSRPFHPCSGPICPRNKAGGFWVRGSHHTNRVMLPSASRRPGRGRHPGGRGSDRRHQGTGRSFLPAHCGPTGLRSHTLSHYLAQVCRFSGCVCMCLCVPVCVCVCVKHVCVRVCVLNWLRGCLVTTRENPRVSKGRSGLGPRSGSLSHSRSHRAVEPPTMSPWDNHSSPTDWLSPVRKSRSPLMPNWGHVPPSAGHEEEGGKRRGQGRRG
uniref:Calcineurin-like phosphoesterase domain-containing protein n=1 Tax=Ornithorhynchus anatinus TaxID=9258 RepID=F6WJR2_ORNAN